MRVIFVKWIMMLRWCRCAGGGAGTVAGVRSVVGFGVVVLALQGGPELDGGLEVALSVTAKYSSATVRLAIFA
jgi:hypothetical protein